MCWCGCAYVSACEMFSVESLFVQETLAKRRAACTTKAREALEKRAEALGKRRKLSLNHSDAPPPPGAAAADAAEAAPEGQRDGEQRSLDKEQFHVSVL